MHPSKMGASLFGAQVSSQARLLPTLANRVRRPGLAAQRAAQRSARRAAQLKSPFFFFFLVLQSAKHEIYGLATGTLPTDRMHFREKVWPHPAQHKLHEKISSSEKLESLGRSPAKHVSTALQTCLRTGTLCGDREAKGSLSENREMFVSNEQIPATFCTDRYSKKM